jgi:threonyl-tRNA synthetase
LVFLIITLSFRLDQKSQLAQNQMWDKAETIMKKVTKELGIKVKINVGDGAFYGPKFDFHIKDSIGRTWQCGTVQLDFSMPDRFELEYVDKDGKKKSPVMIHRTVLGSLERFIGILTEHYAGAFPLWLAPVQFSVISVGASAKKYAKEVYNNLIAAGYRAELRMKMKLSVKKSEKRRCKKYHRC